MSSTGVKVLGEILIQERQVHTQLTNYSIQAGPDMGQVQIKLELGFTQDSIIVLN